MSINCQEWFTRAAPGADPHYRAMAEKRQAELTKPPGSLGRLESLAVQLAALQRQGRPQLERVRIVVFAGDHGVAQEGVSAFPQAVTVEMVKNFSRGGAAVCAATRATGAELEVINMGTVTDPGELAGVRDCRLGAGTANLSREPAMSQEQVLQALAAGRDAVERAALSDTQLFIGGEMGIANTTAAAALACALLEASPSRLAGSGTGLDSAGVIHKAQVIQRALDLHRARAGTPLEMLRCLGGFEIAAMTGAFVASAQKGIPVLVDGFISSVAALAATRLNPDIGEWLLFSHLSAEAGHRAVLDALDARPLLDLGMRLGEGSGAAIAIPLLRQACALHNEMATFSEAGVSGSA